MINTLLGKVFGTKNEREVKRLLPRVAAISALEPEMQKLSDEELRAKTDEFRARIQERLKLIPDEPVAEGDLQGNDGQSNDFANNEPPVGDRQKEIEKRRSDRRECISDHVIASHDFRRSPFGLHHI